MAKLQLSQNGRLLQLPSKLLHFEPTHASRYWVLANILAELSQKDKIEVLDVGGKKGLLRFFSRIKLKVLDIEESNEPNFVKGDALNMPFDDESFDYVVSCDVLEHIRKNDRPRFLREMLRVGRKGVVLCAPFNHGENAALEKKMNDYYIRLTKNQHRWLKEHIDNGLPEEAETEKVLHDAGYNFVKFRHFSPSIWETIVKRHLLHSAFGDSERFAVLVQETYESYYKSLCQFDFSTNGYRTFFVVTKKGDVEIELPSELESTTAREQFHLNNETSFIREFENEMLETRKLLQKQNKQAVKIAAQKQELAELKSELTSIKSHPAWKVLRRASYVKRKIAGTKEIRQ